MIRKVFNKILITVIFILEITSNAYCLEISETVKEIRDDFGTVFVIGPKDSEYIFDKYMDKKYFPIFTKIMSTRESDDELIFELIYLNAVLKDGRYLEYARKISSSPTIALKDVTKFYYYRIGYNKDYSIKFLKRKLDKLLKKPTDSYLITFLPFFEDIEFSLSYMDKLAHVADGATAELLSWAVNYLFYKNIQNRVLLDKIKKSYSYKLYIQR